MQKADVANWLVLHKRKERSLQNDLQDLFIDLGRRAARNLDDIPLKSFRPGHVETLLSKEAIGKAVARVVNRHLARAAIESARKAHNEAKRESKRRTLRKADDTPTIVSREALTTDEEREGRSQIYRVELSDGTVGVLKPDPVESRNEVLASKLDDLLGLGVVPKTNMIPGVGSVQTFVENAKDVFELKHAGEFTKPDQQQASNLFALDFIQGNTDRIFSNMMMDEDGKLWGIDNGDAFKSNADTVGSLSTKRDFRPPPSFDEDLENRLTQSIESGELERMLSDNGLKGQELTDAVNRARTLVESSRKGDLVKLSRQRISDLEEPSGDAPVSGSLGSDPDPIEDGIATTLPAEVQEQIAEFINESFSKDFWENTVGQSVSNDIANSVRRGINDGMSNEEIAKQIEETVGFGRGRARTIARTETTAALNSGRYFMSEAMIDDPDSLVIGRQWVAILDDDVREAHANADGQIVPERTGDPDGETQPAGQSERRTPDETAPPSEDEEDTIPVVENERNVPGGRQTNESFVADINGQKVIYKPHSGEKNPFDAKMDTGLYQREVAASIINDALGLGIVPKTRIVEGSQGIGSAQEWVDNTRLFALSEDNMSPQSKTDMAMFDIIIGNLDRNKANLLVDQEGSFVAIANGFAFARNEERNREFMDLNQTFMGASDFLSPDMKQRIERMDRGAMRSKLSDLLSDGEIDDMFSRMDYIVQNDGNLQRVGLDSSLYTAKRILGERPPLKPKK